jgi:hypothetical protein
MGLEYSGMVDPIAYPFNSSVHFGGDDALERVTLRGHESHRRPNHAVTRVRAIGLDALPCQPTVVRHIESTVATEDVSDIAADEVDHLDRCRPYRSQ